MDVRRGQPRKNLYRHGGLIGRVSYLTLQVASLIPHLREVKSMLSLEQRQALAAQLPWIKRRKRPKERCDGIKWSQVSDKDLYQHGPRDNPKPARGIQERAKCKRRGWWTLKACRPRNNYDYPARSGTYCWEHLLIELRHEPEQERYLRWKGKLPVVTAPPKRNESW